VIFISDPNDPGSDSPENYAIQRVCKGLQVRLITTLAGAEQWANYEAKQYLHEYHSGRQTPGSVGFPENWKPKNWRQGNSNMKEGEPCYLPIEQQTLALIAHDKKKEEMFFCVNKHIDFFGRFDRTLTTGTTGFLLKLLYAGESQYDKIKREALVRLGRDRFRELEETFWLIRLLYCNNADVSSNETKAREELGKEQYEKVLKKLEDRKKGQEVQGQAGGFLKNTLTGPKPEFVDKIMPLPSGPKGGDILIADEILNNCCHTVIFFQDPETAQAHEPDIRLFEKTEKGSHLQMSLKS